MDSVGKSAKQIEMSIAVMISSTAWANRSASKVSSSLRNVSRFSEARLHEELSSDMYSEQGLDAVIRPVSGLVCQSLMVSSYWMPGSAHSQAALAILPNSSPASTGHVCSLCRARSENSLPSSTARMNSSMSGWSTSSTTILAARRVAPPDLIVPALASAPRMNETGPDAVPPELSSSLDERIRERLRPAPEPPLKMKPSSRYQFRIESIESSTERMKHAETCCGEGVPTLNQTGELKEKYWLTSGHVSSCSKISASSGVAK